MLRITSERIDAPRLRIPEVPDAQNGLRKPSQVVVDKAVTVPSIRLDRIDTTGYGQSIVP